MCGLLAWEMFDDFLVGGLEHVLFSPIVGMMIQSDFHILSEGWLNHQAVFYGEFMGIFCIQNED